MEERTRPTWGASWLLPEKYSAAWGARMIADEIYPKGSKNPTHIASLLPDRQNGIGNNKDLSQLLAWVDKNVLPIRLYYDGASDMVTSINYPPFHARWTANKSYGYLYVIAWMD